MSKRLSAQLLNSKMETGRHYDDSGTGLHIYVRKSGSKAGHRKYALTESNLSWAWEAIPWCLLQKPDVSLQKQSLAVKGLSPKLSVQN